MSYINKGQVSMGMGDSLTFRTAQVDAVLLAEAVARRDAFAGVTGRIRHAFAGIGARFAEWRSRQRVLNELAMLSDRDLADIGLTRGDLKQIFDPAFAARYEAERTGYAAPAAA